LRTLFQSALLYELPVLRDLALAQLKRVPPTVPEFGEAKRLIAYLSAFLEIKKHEIPPTSILREFIGESSFNY
jgi:uridine kinase